MTTSSHRPSNDRGPRRVRWFKRYPRLTLLAFSLTTLLVFDVVVGTVVHALGFDPASAGTNTGYRMAHPVYHHGFRPSARDHAYWGTARYEIATDSLGFKSSSPRETPLESDAFRILLIGDSFTEGIGFAHAETFAGLLDARLGDDAEVLNAGVCSYSPTIYNRKVQHLVGTVGLEVGAVLVMIDMSDIEDEATEYRTAPDGTIAHRDDADVDKLVKRFINRHTLFLKSARTAVRQIRFRKRQQAGDEGEVELGHRRCLWGSDDAVWEEFGEAGLRRATARMDELRQFLNERGIPLQIGVYPWPDQIAQGDLEALQVRHWRAWAEKHGVGFTNCFPAFIGHETPDEVFASCFIPGDFHWNAAGHARIADCLLPDLRRLAEARTP